MSKWIDISKAIIGHVEKFAHAIFGDDKEALAMKDYLKELEHTIEEHEHAIEELRGDLKKVQAKYEMLILLTAGAMVLSIVAIVMAIRR